MKTITYNDTRDVSVQIVEYLIDNELLSTKFYLPKYQMQDSIQDRINTMIGIEIGEVEIVNVKQDTNENN